MRMMMLAAAGTAFVLAGAAQAQSPSPQPGPNPSQAPSPTQPPSPPPAIRSVKVVDFDELPDATKTQVDALVVKRSAEDRERLQNAVERAPMIKTAVEAKGFSARDVLIAQIDQNGALTVITRRQA